MASDLEQPMRQLVSVASSVKTDATAVAPPSPSSSILGWSPRERDLSRRFRPGEATIQTLLFFAGILSILTTIGIVIVLGVQSWLFFGTPGVTLLDFFTGTVWQPQIGLFGVMPLVSATLMTSTIAMLIALPLGLFVALYLSEYAPTRARLTVKPMLELLAGVPTVVYGYFALTLITPILRGIFGQNTVQIYNTASAGIVIGILIIPLVASMSEDALLCRIPCARPLWAWATCWRQPCASCSLPHFRASRRPLLSPYRAPWAKR